MKNLENKLIEIFCHIDDFNKVHQRVTSPRLVFSSDSFSIIDGTAPR
jgi:hypothetical protein